MSGEVRRSYCRICAPCCGVLVTVEGERVISVRGDPEHPVSRGYVCPKGRALGEWHHDPRRLDHPEMRVDGELGRVSWDAALDDLAARIRRAVDEVGPDAIAVYQGTPALRETAALPVLSALMEGLGSHSRYSSLTVDISAKLTVTTMMLGTLLLPVVDMDEATFLLVIGTNPVVSHGQYNGFSDPVGRIRAIAERGEVWVVDPRRTESAHHATRYVPIRPGTDHALLAHLVRSVLHRGVDAAVAGRVDGLDELRAAVEPWDRERASATTGIPSGTIDDLVAAVEGAGRIAVLTGTGLTMAQSGNVSEWLALSLLLVTDSFDRPGGMWCNPTYLHRRDRSEMRLSAIDDGHSGPVSRPDLPRFFAEHPCAALADEIEAGNVRALFSFGGNPLVAVAEPERLRRAITRLDAFAIVGTIRDTQAEYATHLLPCTGMLERADVNAGSQAAQLAVSTQYTPPVVAPVAERRPAWWVYAELGRRLGVTVVPDGLDAATATDDDLLAVAAGGTDALAALRAHDGAVVGEPRVTGWALDALPVRRARLAPSRVVAQLAELTTAPPPADALRLVPRRLLRRFNSVHSPSGRQDDQAVLLHPVDAAANGVTDGGVVRVRSAHGELVGPAVVDDGIACGAVAISHGFADVHVGRLVSTTEDIDPLTGMITQTGVEVTVEPV